MSSAAVVAHSAAPKLRLETPAPRPGRAGALRFWGPLAAVVAVALGVRLVDLEADAPLDLEVGHALSIDGAWYTAAALDGATGRPSTTPPSYDRWPFTLWTSLCFALLGPSLRAMQLTSVAPALAAVVLTGLIGRRLRGPTSGVAAAALLAASYPFFVYSRSPVIYAFATATGALAVLLAVEGSHRRDLRVAAAAWVVLLLGIVLVKEALVVLLPVLAAGWPIGHWWRSRRRAAIASAAVAVPLAALAASLLGFHRSLAQKLEDYFSASSPLAVIEAVLGWEERSGFFAGTTVLGAAGVAACFWGRPSREERPLVIAAVAGILVFTPFDSTPLRYLLPLFPLLAVLAASRLHDLLAPTACPRDATDAGHGTGSAVRRSVCFDLAVSLLAGYFAFELGAGVFAQALAPRLALAALASAAVLHGRRSGGGRRLWLAATHRRARAIAAALTIVLALAVDASRVAGALTATKHSVRSALREIDALVAPGAVLSGPFAHLLTAESRLQRQLISSVRFGNGALRRTYEERGVTHLAFDVNAERDKLLAAFRADGAELEPVHCFSIRGAAVELFRFPWGAERAGLSPYERGVLALHAGDTGAALEALREARTAHPDSGAVRSALAEAHVERGEHELAQRAAASAVRLNAYDLRAHGVLATVFLAAGKLAEALPELEALAALEPLNDSVHAAIVSLRRDLALRAR